MLKYDLFKGELDGKTIRHFMSQLNYNGINDVEGRVNSLRDVILDADGNVDEFFVQYFNQDKSGRIYFSVNLNKDTNLSEENFICKQIEKMANYILFCDEAKAENRRSSHPYMTSYASRKVSTNESDADVDSGSSVEGEVDVCNYKKVGKISVSKDDMEIPTMRQLQDIIDLYLRKKAVLEATAIYIQDELRTAKDEQLSSMLTELRSEISKYEKTIMMARDNQKFVKLMVIRPIFFKQPLHDSTDYDLTGIDFGNANHIYALLNNYSSFKQSTYDDLQSELKYIMMDLDFVIERSNLTDVERDIMILKIDGYRNGEISILLQKKYGLEWKDNYIVKVFQEIIPRKVSEQYRKEYEDWYYLNVEKGQYKVCGKCGEVKLTSNFSPDKRNKDGLHSYCKECRK